MIRSLAKGNLLKRDIIKSNNGSVLRGLVLAAAGGSKSSDNMDNNKYLWGGLAAVAGSIIGSVLLSEKKVKCCGIAGSVPSYKGGQSMHGNDDARKFLLESLMIMKNRGYDSAGLATVSNDKRLSLTKFASVGDKADAIELVEEHSLNSGNHSVGIAHTRWATHGAKTDENAHPHIDSSGKIALVHNGTINNSNELRRELQGLGHIFTSQTDTEVISKLIGHYYEIGQDITVQEATAKALQRLDGTWGLCIMCADTPEELVVACNGSPLVIGYSDANMFVASETSAFNRYTKNFISLKDGEIGTVYANGSTLELSRMQKAPDQQIVLTPDPYPDWTIKELLEQPEAIARSLGFGGRLSADSVFLGGLDSKFDSLSKIRHILLSACGTSLHASKYAERLMKQLKCFDSIHSIDAAETTPTDFPNVSNVSQTGVIVVSQSGETKDVHRVVNLAMNKEIPVLSVVNAVGSLIARTTNLGVYCNAGRENAVASTKAFTTQVTSLALVALWFRQTRDKVEGLSESLASKRLKDALMRLPISFGMGLKTRPQCKDIAQKLLDKEHCFVLGKGFGEAVALEGALKIKEICYLHAEGYSGGALKHGPFALIENEEGKFGRTPIIMLILDDEHAQHMRTAAEEVKARGAEIFVITDKRYLADGIDDNPIVIPSNGPLTALCAVLPLQLIAYELAKLRKIDPDTPRNLAKAVTVD